MANVFYLDEYRNGKAQNAGEASRVPPVDSKSPLGRGMKRVPIELKPRRADALKAAAPILLWHVSYGRNAWHSTWIARYVGNSLMANRDEAAQFINERLKQGTAYRWTVMPAWHLQFDMDGFLVCEINTSSPFQRLRSAAFLEAGAKQVEVLQGLDPRSALWDGPPPRHDSIIVQQTSRPAENFIPWAERTSHSNQIHTPGRYKRVLDGKRWHMTAFADDIYDTSHFEKFVSTDTA